MKAAPQTGPHPLPRLTLTFRLTAVLVLLFAAMGTSFVLVNQAALETERERLLADIRSHFAARVAALDRTWLESGHAIGRQLDLWLIETVELTAEDREARLRRLMLTLLAQGPYSDAAIVGSDGKAAFRLGNRSRDALAPPKAADSSGLGWVYSEPDRALYRTVSSPVQHLGRPSTLVLYVPIDNALLGELDYPRTQLQLQRQGVRIAASASTDSARRVGMSDESVDERAVVELPWDSVEDAPVLHIERRFITPLSDRQLLLILAACAAGFGGGAWLVLGRWIRSHSRRLRTLQEVTTAYGAGSVRSADLEQRLEHAAKGPDDIDILAGKLHEMLKRIEGARLEQARSQQTQATLNTRLAAVIDSASDAVISTDREGRIVLFNPAAEQIFGHAAAQILGNRLDMLLLPHDRSRHSRDVGTFASSGVTSRRMGAGRVQGLRADGSTLELEASISQVTIEGDQVLTAILRDVTERVRTERALMQYQLELTELAHQLMAQEKTTSSRLAQVLHDQLGQTLTAMRIDFVAEARFTDAAEAARHARVDWLIDQAVREVRQVLVELRPTVLDERGLVDALDDELATRRSSAQGVQLLLDAPPALAAQRWASDVEYAAFMVAREAIANALRHAQATQVRVSLQGGPGTLRLEVTDNGAGLAPDDLATKAGHLGMVGMRERSIAIGARFEMQSLPGEGATVRLIWKDAKA